MHKNNKILIFFVLIIVPFLAVCGVFATGGLTTQVEVSVCNNNGTCEQYENTSNCSADCSSSQNQTPASGGFVFPQNNNAANNGSLEPNKTENPQQQTDTGITSEQNTTTENNEIIIIEEGKNGTIEIKYPDAPEINDGEEDNKNFTDTKFEEKQEDENISIFFEKLNELEVNPTVLFSPLAEEETGVLLSPEVVSDKIVYNLEFNEESQNPELGGKEIAFLDLSKVNLPIFVNFSEKTIAVGSEQEVIFRDTYDSLAEQKVLLSATINEYSLVSENNQTGRLIIDPSNDRLAFANDDSGIQVITKNNLKIVDKKVVLYKNEKDYELQVGPLDAIKVLDDKIKNNKIELKTASLEIIDNKPVYQIKLKQEFKFLWLFPCKVDTKVKVDAEKNIVSEARVPWYVFFGKFNKVFSRGEKFIK